MIYIRRRKTLLLLVLTSLKAVICCNTLFTNLHCITRLANKRTVSSKSFAVVLMSDQLEYSLDVFLLVVIGDDDL